MLNIGFGEIIVIAIVAIIALRPSDIPRIMFLFGQVARHVSEWKKSLLDKF